MTNFLAKRNVDLNGFIQNKLNGTPFNKMQNGHRFNNRDQFNAFGVISKSSS